jgi:hypothetical protein
MRLVRTVGRRVNLLVLLFCASLLVAGCGGDDSATTSSDNTTADTPDTPSAPGTPAASDPPPPAVDRPDGPEPEFAQSDPDTQVTEDVDDLAAQAGNEEFQPGSFFGTAGGGQKIKLVLLESGGIEQFLNGQKMETIQIFETSKVKWTIIGEEVQLTLPNLDAVFYRIEDSNTIVGPVARISVGRPREVTAASTRQVFKRGSGSTVATSDEPRGPAERPVERTAAAQPPVNAKVGLEVGNLAPEIIGEDIDGKKFKLSDYRGKVVMLDFWGDW